MGIRAGSPVYITSLCSLLCCSLAQADTVGYVANPTANSIDFGAGVTALGGVMNTSVNFDTHPTGTLVGNFYTASQGVTLTPFGDVDTVLFGPGPDGATSPASRSVPARASTIRRITCSTWARHPA